MLVLARKPNESVVVGGDDGLNRLLKVTVLEIRKGLVTLGFEADESVPIHRSEVWDRIKAQNWGDESVRTVHAANRGKYPPSGFPLGR